MSESKLPGTVTNVTFDIGRFTREKDYWLSQLSGELVKTHFPYDFKPKDTAASGESPGIVKFDLNGDLFAKLMKLSNGSDPRLHMVLTAGLLALLNKYTGNKDLLVGAPIYRQTVEGKFINSILVLRNRLEDDMTFKELLIQVKNTVVEAVKNQGYPLERLVEDLDLPKSETGTALFDIAVLLENIHDKTYLRHSAHNMTVCFHRDDTTLQGTLEYSRSVYRRETAERIAGHLKQVLAAVLHRIDTAVADVDILSDGERKQLLSDFNDTRADYPREKTIHRLFEEQVEKTPDNIALTGPPPEGDTGPGSRMTYTQLNRESNRLAAVLKRRGVTAGSVVGVLMTRSPETVAALMAVLKAGGAYLPIKPELPGERILYMLADSGAGFLLTHTAVLEKIPFTALRNFEKNRDIPVKITAPRGHIKGVDRLPMPDRSLINLKNYKNKIGMASVTDSITLQTTRGCPYECLYCHKIWSKKHVFRSAENIYNEIEYYNRKGVVNFAVIDDCFNLHRENSSRLFQLIIKNRLKIQLFFPNGLRGDIMTPDYIDAMVEAGTRGINLSLETASPRLQKLLKKDLDLEKFKEVVDYIAEKHPNVILEMATMHGFPSETEEEAMKTLDFIKSIRWLHFPYIHILKIFPNTEMEDFALEHGIPKKDILLSRDRAFHELPETLPFSKNFTRRYQANFLNEYFLSPERLTHVLPVQMKILSEEALAQKYNAYLPVEIKSATDIIRFAQLDDIEIPENPVPGAGIDYSIFDEEPVVKEAPSGAKKILLLDLSQHFSSHAMLYKVSEQPLGHIYLLTYLKKRFGDKLDGRIYKSGNDFDSFDELRALVEAYRPDIIGIRTLTFFKEFFHETVSSIREWGVTVPIITGGPYASSDYDTILKDRNISLVVFGEGEETTTELIEKMMENRFQIPGPDVLDTVAGIAYAGDSGSADRSRDLLFLDRMGDIPDEENPGPALEGGSLAYVMYTSGSTGKPKGVMVEHCQVNNCTHWMQEKFGLTPTDVAVQRTDLTFDPSVWEIFWPLAVGAGIRVIPGHRSKDAEFLIRLMSEDSGMTIMYCPATLVNAMTYLLEAASSKPELKLPLLIIGAEPIGMDVVKRFYHFYRGRIVNTYGPTECTINNTYYDLLPDDERSVVPIGRPVANNKLYILSSRLGLLPVRTAGEICISGDSVARGYVNNIEKTAAQFVANPFEPGTLYKTGDIGRWNEDGTIEIMGRVDEQVKIRGYRIEPGEIENILASYPSVDECVVVVRDKEEKKVGTCKQCGITTEYPGITIDDESICGICRDYNLNKKHMDAYFGTLDQLEQLIKDRNKNKESEYDCLLLYAGGRGAGYALYQLVERGLKVLALTYDNGYFSKRDMENIKKITSKLGVPHVALTHKNSDHILRESMKSAHTVCRGCFHTSSSLAGQYAYENNINVVVGATLSRGQIIENKLLMFYAQGIRDVGELEKEILNIQKATPEIDKNIFDYIDIDVVSSGAVHEKVKFVDFYRYTDVTNEEMIDYLNRKAPYWKTRKDYAVYSTNCSIKQVGDYGHLKERGYHYYGAATSWEKRLGHLTLENLKEDLTCGVTRKGFAAFMKRVGEPRVDVPGEERSNNGKPGSNGKYLCAYFVSPKELPTPELKEYLSKELPDYMVPSYFVQLKDIPLTAVGKIDKKALPAPDISRAKTGVTYVAPKTPLERTVAGIWQEVLKLDRVGIEDNFFDLGGNSLDIIMTGSKLKEKIQKELPAVTLFNYPTVRSLVDHLSAQRTGGPRPPVPEESEKRDRTREAGRNRLNLRRNM